MIGALYSVFRQGASCIHRLIFAPDHPTAELARYNSLFTSRINQLQTQQQLELQLLSRTVTELSTFDSLFEKAEKIWAACTHALTDFLQTLKAQDLHLRPYAIVHEISSLTEQTIEDCQRLQSVVIN